jgi:hypothetical protein
LRSTGAHHERPLRYALLLAALAAAPAHAGSLRDCRLVQKPDSWFSDGIYAAAITDGSLRTLLVRRADGPSSVMDFSPWKNGQSVDGEMSGKDNVSGYFWVAGARPDGRITIDRWSVDGGISGHDTFVFDCPEDARPTAPAGR